RTPTASSGVTPTATASTTPTTKPTRSARKPGGRCRPPAAPDPGQPAQGSDMPRPFLPRWMRAAVAAGAALLCGAVRAQTAYKYRDGGANWVFPDRAATAKAGEALPLEHEPEGGLHIEVSAHTAGAATELVGTNGCLCAISLRLVIVKSELAALPAG